MSVKKRICITTVILFALIMTFSINVCAMSGPMYEENVYKYDLVYYDKVGEADISYPLLEKTRIAAYYGQEDDGVHDHAHQGLDLAADLGDPVIAADSGTVNFVHYWEGGTEGANSYGNCVDILLDDGTVHRYAHMSEINVCEGDYVQMAQQIGRVGDTGHSFGTHLHFEVLKNGTAVDPLPYLYPSKLKLMLGEGCMVTLRAMKEENEESYTYYISEDGCMKVLDTNMNEINSIQSDLFYETGFVANECDWFEADKVEAKVTIDGKHKLVNCSIDEETVDAADEWFEIDIASVDTVTLNVKTKEKFFTIPQFGSGKDIEPAPTIEEAAVEKDEGMEDSVSVVESRVYGPHKMTGNEMYVGIASALILLLMFVAKKFKNHSESVR